MSELETLRSALAGRYELEREIGAGGMANVFLARDLKHDRQVALKVLKPELGAVLGVERFLAEIKVTANLQHPNLLPLFDSGEVGGLLFYVMPFVEGESLRAKLEREKQLPVDEAVRITVAIANALEYAHQHGVIHRDLKPENILIQAGQPVIADFGIALAVSNAGGARVTQTGLSLGTPQYMSPEQATGDRAIDGRTDLYSLAAMLYEMLTGDPPHTASTAQGIIAKVLTDRPRSVRGQRTTVPVHVEIAIERALEKLPADRWASVQQFSEQLQGRSTSGSATGYTSSWAPTTAGNRSLSARLADPLVVGLAVLTAAAVVWSVFGASRAKPADSPVVRFALALDSGATPSYDLGTWSVVPSPDGKAVVYTADVKGVKQLFIRQMDQLHGRPILGTISGAQPIFSPDGKWIAFLADGKLKKVLVDGGTPLTLTDAGANNGADWSTSDVIVLGAEAGHSGLTRLPSAGGTLVEFTKVDKTKGETSHLWPIVLADGNTIVFTIYGTAKTGSRLGITTLKDGGVTNLGVAGIAPLGVFEGQLVYVQADGAVMAVPIDVGGRKVTGNPVPILDPVPICAGCNGDAAVRASVGGAIAYMRGSTLGRLVWVDRKGNSQVLRPESGDYSAPRISPDGGRIAVQIGLDGKSDIWILQLASGTLSRLTSGGTGSYPEWSPDGTSVIFSAGRDGQTSVFRQAADGSGKAERLANGFTGGAISPDGKTLLYELFGRSGDVMTKSIGDTLPPRPFLATPAHEFGPRFSPDGRWVVYYASEGNEAEVYVRAFAGDEGRVQISAGGGVEPRWSADGRDIYYRSGRRLMVAHVQATPTFALVSRDTVFEAAYNRGQGSPGYDVARDGSRFVMVKGNEDNMQVIVVSNWLAELRAKTAPKK